MHLLLIHTCAAEGLVALSRDSEVIASQQLPGRTASEQAMPAIRRMLEAHSLRAADLAAVAVVNGPGSFTGVRVGLSLAKGLCEAASIPMIAISRLALLASGFSTENSTVVALLDAGRGEYYCGVYGDGPGGSETLLSLHEVQHHLLSGRGVTSEQRVAEALDDSVQLIPEPGASEILGFARPRFNRSLPSDVLTVDANYLRRTDAELLKAK